MTKAKPPGSSPGGSARVLTTPHEGNATGRSAPRICWGHVLDEARRIVLSHDPSGHDILRDFTDRTDRWKAVQRIALTPEQVAEYRLPEAMGKATDSRKHGFVARFGELVQVELDALPPDVLRDLYAAGIAEFWDESAFEETMQREAEECAALDEFARLWLS